MYVHIKLILFLYVNFTLYIVLCVLGPKLLVLNESIWCVMKKIDSQTNSAMKTVKQD